MIRAVLIDRDGTINVDKGYVYKPEDFELLPGAVEGLKLLSGRRIKIFIITNQAGIAKGYYTEDHFKNFTEFMLSVFQEQGIVIEETLHCPHHPEGIIPEYTKECACRKPGTLLIESIIKQNRYKENELALIGDKNSDIEAGHKLGLTTYLVLSGYGSIYKENTKATYIVPDLLRAVQHLLNIESVNKTQAEVPGTVKDL
jgi:D-glycero-D-manno-heptose 1,7-bisphosphate phosphatase